MGDSRINYLGENGKSWSPVRGCSRVSEGCRNCWAERDAIRRAKPGEQCHGLVRPAHLVTRTQEHRDSSGAYIDQTDSTVRVGPRWTGEVRLIEKDLDAPLRWGGAQRIAVCFGGDLFHEKVKREWIVDVFGVMAVAAAREYANATGGCFHRPADGVTLQRCGDTTYHWPKHLSGPHAFLVLTKRAPRMRELLSSGSFREEVSRAAFRWAHNRRDAGYLADCISASDNPCATGRAGRLWPLPNVWLGVSAEDQPRADERIPHLLETPAAVRWVSLEPLLGPVDHHPSYFHAERCNPRCAYPSVCRSTSGQGLSWVVVGGESGPGARPFNLEWAEQIIEQGRAAGCAVYIKQLGAASFAYDRHGKPFRVPLRDRKGADPLEWPEDLRVREMPR